VLSIGSFLSMAGILLDKRALKVTNGFPRQLLPQLQGVVLPLEIMMKWVFIGIELSLLG